MPDYKEQYRELIAEVVELVASARSCCDALLRTEEGAPDGFTGDLISARTSAAETLASSMAQVLDFTGRLNSIPRLLDGGRKFPDYVAFPDGARMLQMMNHVENVAPIANAFELNGSAEGEFTPALSREACEKFFDDLESVIDGISELHNGSAWLRTGNEGRQESDLGALIAALK